MANIFQNFFKKVKKTSGYTGLVEKQMEQFVRDKHLAELRKIVAPFETEIPLHVVKINNMKDVTFIVEPISGLFTQRTNALPDPGDVETAALFYYLNDGVNGNRHAQMPKGYERESHPNSTNTSSKDNVREAILVSKKYHYSIEPRNWLQLVEQKHRDGLEKAAEVTTKDFVKTIFGR